MYIPSVFPAYPILLALIFLGVSALPAAEPPKPDSVTPSPDSSRARTRTFRTFLPEPGRPAQEPKGRIVQLLLDRQAKSGEESYLLQVLFRGQPAAERAQRTYPDRVEIDFYDTGKPAMRPARVRGGALEATSLEELNYLDGGKVKSLVRLTLFTSARPLLKFRNTLDRTLVIFRLPLESRPAARDSDPDKPDYQPKPPAR